MHALPHLAIPYSTLLSLSLSHTHTHTHTLTVRDIDRSLTVHTDRPDHVLAIKDSRDVCV